MGPSQILLNVCITRPRLICALQKWIDYKLRWDPDEYGGVDMLYVPSQHIWLPDIVLFNK